MKKRNFIIYFLVSVLFFSSCFSYDVNASSVGIPEAQRVLDSNSDGKITLDEVKDYTLPFRVVMNIIGVTAGSPIAAVSLADKIAESDAYQNFLEKNEPAELVIGYLTDDNFFYFSDGVFDVTKNFVEEQKKENGFFVIPAISYGEYADFINELYEAGMSSSEYMIWYNAWNGKEKSFDGSVINYNFGSGSGIFFVNLATKKTYTGEKVVRSLSSSGSSYIDEITYSGGNYSQTSLYCTAHLVSSSSYRTGYSQMVSVHYAGNNDDYFVGCIGYPMIIYGSVADYVRYTGGYSSIYCASNLSADADDYKIKLDVLNGTDWDLINSSLYGNVVNNIQSGDSLSSLEIQNIIDSYFSKFQESLDILIEGSYDSNQSLDEILAQLSADGQRQSSWLSKIHSLLQEHLPLIGSGGGSGFGASSDQLEEIIKLLEKNVNTLEDIERDTSQIKGLLALDTSMNFFGLLNTKLSQSTDTLKTKFPTSIPWDVVAVVSFMAEEPEAPVFDIPIKVESVGIDENIHIDLSENSKTSNLSSLSKISRTLLTITFIVYLMIFTKNFTGKGD